MHLAHTASNALDPVICLSMIAVSLLITFRFRAVVNGFVEMDRWIRWPKRDPEQERRRDDTTQGMVSVWLAVSTLALFVGGVANLLFNPLPAWLR